MTRVRSRRRPRGCAGSGAARRPASAWLSSAGLIGAIKVVAAIAIVRIPIYARLVRGSVLSIKEKEYIEASRALGQRDLAVLTRHVFPNCLAPIVVTTTLGIATAIIVEALDPRLK